jgi:hypothetical protein
VDVGSLTGEVTKLLQPRDIRVRSVHLQHELGALPVGKGAAEGVDEPDRVLARHDAPRVEAEQKQESFGQSE